MRAADEDRRQVAEQLQAALTEGRLDLTEYDQRVQEAYSAKTYADLDRLLTDLPNAAPLVPATPAPAPVAVEDNATRAWLGHVWGTWARMAAFFTLIWGIASIASGEPLFYWPVWVIGPYGVVLVFQTIDGLAHGKPRRYAEESEHRRRLRTHKQERKELYRRAIAAGELSANPSKEQRKAFIAEAISRGDLAPKPRRPDTQG
ncbi:DUF1707 domain-containing protein [Actinoplanes bogorensis]|uniref:DUF1707 domain-containing protein n=2 Tax=Paractinoplanes bogorensis TaxID=1610840 RepID=A0ABS5YYY9_9ACTN|nr:DUF1707 domain-containing protein [Actinoplanes bogorensis]